MVTTGRADVVTESITRKFAVSAFPLVSLR
jgi:hypothetical protein